jgi:hypothetical protein
MDKSPVHRLLRVFLLLHVVLFYLRWLGRSVINAHLNKEILGCAKITHPYHPFKGQSFKILQSRNIANEEILSLKGSSRGTFAVRKEWTDKYIPDPIETNTNIFSIKCLIELIELTEKLKEKRS